MSKIVQPSFDSASFISKTFQVNDLRSKVRTDTDDIDAIKDIVKTYLQKLHPNFEVSFTEVENREDLNNRFGRLEYEQDSKGKQTATIKYLRNDHPAFTILHEVAHLFLHVLPDMDIKKITVDREKGVEKALVESEANIFATCVLVPTNEIAKFINDDKNERVTVKDIMDKFSGIVPPEVMKDYVFELMDDIRKDFRELQDGSQSAK